MIPYHDGKGVPPEETTVYVGDDAYCECAVRPLDSQTTRNRRSEEYRPKRGTDLVLIWELCADKVVGDPTNTSNCHKDDLFSGFLTLYIPIHLKMINLQAPCSTMALGCAN